MRIFFDNVNVLSTSGPNSFGRKLMSAFSDMGHEAYTNRYSADVQISFIQISKKLLDCPTVLRLDGIYFNTRQDWMKFNSPIQDSFKQADSVVFQSEFNRRLTEKYFGPSRNAYVINNGTSLSDIDKIPMDTSPILNRFDEIWCCSSSWRPHKRLQADIEYFLRHRPSNTGLVVLGENPDYYVDHPDILYVGKQSWETCVSVYKRSRKFIHLAFLDHCPNVVVDARACGCDIVVASSGGTREIAGPEAIVVKDLDWDLRPLDLYSPPILNLDDLFVNGIESDIDIRVIADRYHRALFETVSKG